MTNEVTQTNKGGVPHHKNSTKEVMHDASLTNQSNVQLVAHYIGQLFSIVNNIRSILIIIIIKAKTKVKQDNFTEQ